MVADELDYVIGVDTHLDEHVLAIIAAPSGAIVAQRSIHASACGYAAALRFAAEKAEGTRVWAIEGTGSYGAGLARFLAGRAETVLEMELVTTIGALNRAMVSSTKSSNRGPPRLRRRCSNWRGAPHSRPRSCSPKSDRSTASRALHSSPATAASHRSKQARAARSETGSTGAATGN